jgi:apolipoprotein D and lipocalin family protein
MTQAPIKTVSEVNLKQFMGPWYVIAHIPTFIEKNAFNAVESYVLNEDGTIGTTFTFNEGSLTGADQNTSSKRLCDERFRQCFMGNAIYMAYQSTV